MIYSGIILLIFQISDITSRRTSAWGITSEYSPLLEGLSKLVDYESDNDAMVAVPSCTLSSKPYGSTYDRQFLKQILIMLMVLGELVAYIKVLCDNGFITLLIDMTIRRV